MTSVEWLKFVPQSDRTGQMMQALMLAARKADIRVKQTDRYYGQSEWLLIWGPGGPDRFGPMRKHLEKGGHVIALDLAYWSREKKVRIAIDAAHPQAWVMRSSYPSDRFRQDPTRTDNRWDHNGPAIIAGIGEKARVQYGDAVGRWEAEMIEECRVRGLEVRYRPKFGRGPIPGGVPVTTNAPIEDVLNGASLLITWHSNVAVDAIRMGIPVLCRDGAAAAIYGSAWPETGLPTPIEKEQRDQFLSNLAWFQWAPNEAVACWKFLHRILA